MKAVAKKPNQESPHKKRGGADYSRPGSSHGLDNGLPAPMVQLKPLCPCDGGCPRCRGAIQPKLKIGDPDDAYEQEADRVADLVMRAPDPSCTACREEGLVQAKSTTGAVAPSTREPVGAGEAEGSVPARARIHCGQCPGQPLPPTARAFFEPRFGHELNRVRLHTCNDAVAMCTDVSARAFTYGSSIFFNAGEYRPESPEGEKLLAHELTHVIQQRCARRRIQRLVNGKSVGRFRTDAQVCLVHLHADEQNALAAANDIHGRYRANMVNLTNPYNHRCVEITGLPGSRSCMADPNRIFSTVNKTRDCSFRACNSRGLPSRLSNACSCGRALRGGAAADLHGSYRSGVISKINQCRGGQGADAFDTNQNLLPIVVFHNNTSFNISEYASSGSDEWAAATTAEIQTMAQASAPPITLPTSLTNPMGPASTTSGRRTASYYRNFFLTTDLQDFLNLGAAGHNVVLQSPNPRARSGNACTGDDGSLSIALGSAHLVTIEAASKRSDAHVTAFNTRMAEAALTQLGISPIPTGQVP